MALCQEQKVIKTTIRN